MIRNKKRVQKLRDKNFEIQENSEKGNTTKSAAVKLPIIGYFFNRCE